MNVLKFNRPLYDSDFYICDLWGGRGGGRSYAYTQYALYLLVHSPIPIRGFFLREVHKTIYDSMWSDLVDRIKEYEEYHKVTLTELEWSDNKQGENVITNKITGSSIKTKGFKTSSENQSASLKSLASATHLFIEEAEEVEEAEFTKLQMSLRKVGVKIQIVRAFNPPSKDHWLWKDYQLIKLSTEQIAKIISVKSGRDYKDVFNHIKNNGKEYYFPKSKRDNHLSIHATYYENRININKESIEVYESFYTSDLDYYLSTVLGLISGRAGLTVYHEYQDKEHHTDRIVEEGDILHIGMDFNIGNMSAIVHVVDEGIRKAVSEEVGVFDTEAMCRILQDKYSGHRIFVYPDATGSSRKSSSGRSDHDIIRSYGFTIKVGKTNPAVRNRVNSMNSSFATGKYFVNRYTCPSYSESLKNQVYKKGEPDKTKGYDHTNDAGGYFVAFDNINTEGSSMRVMRRRRN